MNLKHSLIAVALLSGFSLIAEETNYVSPYRLRFIHPTNESAVNSLTFDFNQWPRNDVTAEASLPKPADWYNRAAYDSAEAASEGPIPAHYPAPAGVTNYDVTWKRERVLATAAKWLGSHYQHHHIPDWNPTPPQCTADWPWQEVSLGTNSAGIDCSCYTAFVYNYALGIRLESSITNQAAQTTVLSADGESLPVHEVVRPDEALDYASLVRRLMPGDLLYIRATNTPGTRISHVIMWLGPCGVSTNGELLILDSHDNKPSFKDSAGVVVPAGVAIRPFRKDGWYFRCFDHAHRILDYATPYRVQYTHPANELAFDFNQWPRNSVTNESSLPVASWYSESTLKGWGSWGPPSAQYPAPTGLATQTVAWLQERILVTAEKDLGYDYQHHHIPDWSPTPPNYTNAVEWPCTLTNGYPNAYGVDCSDFTAFIYNYGLGIKMTSDVGLQAALTNVPGPGGRGRVAVQAIPRSSYETLTNQLASGDLLYIRGVAASPEISHVILWLGQCGLSTNGEPLVIDSHGNAVFDSKGERIPAGVHIRPFHPNSWYYACFDHANRILVTNLPVAPPLSLWPIANGSIHPALAWSNYPGETYVVERSTQLTSGFQILPNQIPAATEPVNTFTDTNALGDGAWFYRVGLKP